MPKITALVVDDSKVMRLMVIRALNRIVGIEWEYIEAADGAEALGVFNTREFDIGFVDWNMPNMPGIEFVRQMRATGNSDHIPLVMVTSEKTVAKIEEALSDAGANAYICKPFTEDDIAKKVGPLLEAVVEMRGEEAGFFSKLLA
jgi:two-component system, chemotaxis family, chemotaxis protein CheY